MNIIYWLCISNCKFIDIIIIEQKKSKTEVKRNRDASGSDMSEAPATDIR